jgi:hypothetical protein
MLLENALTANKGPFWFVETGIRKISFTQKLGGANSTNPTSGMIFV